MEQSSSQQIVDVLEVSLGFEAMAMEPLPSSGSQERRREDRSPRPHSGSTTPALPGTAFHVLNLFALRVSVAYPQARDIRFMKLRSAGLLATPLPSPLRPRTAEPQIF